MSESCGSGSESEEEEWEDVESLPPDLVGRGGASNETATTGVEIVLPLKGSSRKGTRKKNALERAMDAFNRDLRHNLHKTSLLCLLAQGIRLSHCHLPSDPLLLLQARLLSLVPRELTYNTASKLHKLLKWYSVRREHLLKCLEEEVVEDEVERGGTGTKEGEKDGGTVEQREGGDGGGVEGGGSGDGGTGEGGDGRGEGSAGGEREGGSGSRYKGLYRDSLGSVQMLVAILKVLGLRTRLVLALNPISFKPQHKRKKPDSPTKVQETNTSEPAVELGMKTDDLDSKLTARSSVPSLSDVSDEGGHMKPSPHFFKLMETLRHSSNSELSGTTSTAENYSKNFKTDGEGGREGGRDEENESNPTKRKNCKGKTAVRSRNSTRKRKLSSQNFNSNSNKKRKVSISEVEKTVTSPTTTDRSVGRKRKGKEKMSSRTTTPSTTSETSPYFTSEKSSERSFECPGESDSDSDFIPLRKRGKRLSFVSMEEEEEEEEIGEEGMTEQKETKMKKIGRKRGSVKVAPKSPQTTDLKTRGEDMPLAGVYDERNSWVEVLVEDDKRFVCLHLPSCSVDQPSLCEKHCPYRLSYVIAIESRDGVGSGNVSVSDVTARYAAEWCTLTRRHRLGGAWWMETLRPFSPGTKEREREEEDIMNILYSHPLPTSINDYKSHPLYVLRRHLLKFEAIYPVDSKILGYCKGEPIFSRDCVFTLHTRETWLKEGKVFKKDEEPYKVVKARPKKGASLEERERSMVEVFGVWQTEIYIPPPVINGVVPKNEYGNVELFQPSMLPAGASHIRITGIQKVARKLDISYAPAMIGWDFHGGHCCPMIDGVVVAEENEQLLLEAWRQEQQIIIEKEMKKREARVVERWKKMVRGLLIRQRVQKTYHLT